MGAYVGSRLRMEQPERGDAARRWVDRDDLPAAPATEVIQHPAIARPLRVHQQKRLAVQFVLPAKELGELGLAGAGGAGDLRVGCEFVLIGKHKQRYAAVSDSGPATDRR